MGFNLSLSGSQLSFTGGSLTLSNVNFATIVASAAPEGGVQITFSSPPIILSGGASVSLAVAATSAQSAEAASWSAPAKPQVDEIDFRSDRPSAWHMGDSVGHWEVPHVWQSDLFAVA